MLRKKNLVLFACWVPDDSENSIQWTDFYYKVASENLAESDIIIAFNDGCSEKAKEKFLSSKNIISWAEVKKDHVVSSDASGFQLCLEKCQNILANYEKVLFLHTKGVTKSFESYSGFRWLFGNKIMNDIALNNISSQTPEFLAGIYFHAPTYGTEVRTYSQLTSDIGFKLPFLFNVTYTIYVTSASVLSRLLLRHGNFITKIKIQDKYDRFFFEHFFPSLLVGTGANLMSLDTCKLNPELNPNLSYNYDLSHCTKIVMSLYEKWKAGSLSEQFPVPMIFGELDKVKNLHVRFNI